MLNDYQVPVDAPYLHGLLTGSATIPVLNLEKLVSAMASEWQLPGLLTDAVLDVVGQLSMDLFDGSFEARFQLDQANDAERWIRGYLKAVEIHEEQWLEAGERHPHAGAALIMFNSMVNDDLRDEVDMDLPGRRDLRENPHWVTRFALDIFHHFNDSSDDDLDLSADDLPPLPIFSDEELGAMSEPALFALIIDNEDRLTLEVVHECARRKAAMVPILHQHLANDAHWGEDVSSGEWWALLHAVFILGLIDGEAAASALLVAFRRIAYDSDGQLADWVSASWPALLHNKIEFTTGPMRRIAEDPGNAWYPGAQAIDCVLAEATDRGSDQREDALDWLATMCGDPSEDPGFRVMASNSLLNQARERHRKVLVDLVGLQKPDTWFADAFRLDEVDEAIDNDDDPEWERFDDPWQFYEPEEIQNRQIRWLKEAMDDEPDVFGMDDLDLDTFEPMETFVREHQKIGRNEPCPCGSGKKYKACCLRKMH